MNPITLMAARGRLKLRLVCVSMGDDLLLALTGGDREHVGAVALAQGRPSLEAGGAPSATTSVLALLGHKEDDLARRLATRLANRIGSVVCLACGIHLDRITAEELASVENLAEELGEELLARLRDRPGEAAPC
jgi:gallate decarboxylase subunit D